MTSSDFAKQRHECLAKGKLFEDSDFPAVDSSLFYHQKPALGFEWKRPKEICDKPKFVVDSRDLYDITPGRLGELSFVSVLGVLYQYRGLFYRVVPADQGFTQDYEYAGIFHFRIWWSGEWTEVLVDDRLPTVNGQLVFAHAQTSNQFWAALLEKAYAKLHGSYEALQYVTAIDNFSELTGGTTERLNVKVEDVCLRQLCGALKLTAIVSAATIQTGSGGSKTLLRLRLSPGIAGIYNGAWAIAGRGEWKNVSSKEKERIELSKTDASEFWIAWEEFVENFTHVDVLYLDEDTCQSEKRFRELNVRPPAMKMFQGYWKKGVTAGGCRNHSESFHINPQLMLAVPQADELCIALIQHHFQDPRVIGFTIYEAPASLHLGSTQLLDAAFFQTHKAVKHTEYTNARQVLQRMQFAPGRYVIVPTTYDSATEGTFTLRIYGQSNFNLSLLDNSPTMTKPVVIKAGDNMTDYRLIFGSIADEKRMVNAYELQELMHNCLPNDYIKSCASLDVCRKVVKAFGGTHVLGRIDYAAFNDFLTSLKSWQEVFGYYSAKTSGVMKAELTRAALSDVGIQINTDIACLILLRYMRRDGTLRFGDFVAAILQLIACFALFARKDSSENGLVKLNSSDWLKAVLRC